MKKVLLFALVLLLAAGMVFAGGSKEKGEGGEKADGGKQFLVIKSSSIGGSWYACGAAYAKLITDHTNYIAMNSASPGLTNETIKRMAEGKAHIGLADGTATYAAYMGNAPWESKQDVRAMFGIWPGIVNCIVNADSNIKSLADLKGKSIATYVEGEPGGEAYVEMLGWMGINKDNSKIYRIMKNDATRMFIDGQADCLIYAFGHGHAKLKEMTSARKIRFVHVAPDIEKRFMEKNPEFAVEEFGSEFGVPDEKQFVSYYFLICMNSMPEDQVYELVKVWWENRDFLEQTLPSNIPYVNWKDPKFGVPIPLHAGAEKYFKEKGIIK